MPGRTDRLRILVADDHPLFREGVVRAVRERPEFELVGEAADGRQALEAIRELTLQVAVLDVKMPELDGLRVLNAVRRDGLATRVVLLSAYLDGATAFEAVAGGAAAFLQGRRPPHDPGHHRRGEPRRDGPGSRDPGRARRGDPHAWGEGPPRPLARELEILNHIAEGSSAPEIGRLIHLSPATVKSHLQSLYEKLGVSDRAAAVAEAMRRGLLE